ncbi:hypothetical protein E1A91_A11G354400v1 [Gossypium mustelinum]|uniref:Uncharacterized protein n=1 Tax=Gossypium mustelinum TaxID=34275 RepID=A0A5D2XER7_GOSMU|nr:hypothetical protein E1A91_A11G354400v1 [Gossypium mustelinum]
MESGSLRLGLMAVVAVSGSVVFIANELHKRLLSDFMKKIEFELAGNSYIYIIETIYDFLMFFLRVFKVLDG